MFGPHRGVSSLRGTGSAAAGRKCVGPRSCRGPGPWCAGGDGGNRTRVRKSGRSDFYERSRLMLSLEAPSTGKGPCLKGAAGLTRRAAASPAWHPDFVPPTPAPVGARSRGTGSRLWGAYSAVAASGSHGQSRDRSAHGTSCACAGFTRSRTSARHPAPTLSRRTHASPKAFSLYTLWQVLPRPRFGLLPLERTCECPGREFFRADPSNCPLTK